MQRTRSSLPAAAKAAGLAALVLGLTFGSGASPAAAQLTGQGVAARTSDDADCGHALDAAIGAAEQTLEVAFRADRRALEQLREKAGDHNSAAKDLLNNAARELKRIFSAAASTLDGLDDDDAACAATDLAALDATVTGAVTAMDQIVTDATAAVAALPADQAKAKDEDDD